MLEAYPSDTYTASFWHAITDANGDFAIAMDSANAGNPWSVEIVRNPHPPSIAQPEYRELTVTGNHTGLDFSLVAAADQAAGTVTSEFMSPLLGLGVQLINPSTGFIRDGLTDANGFYQVGVLAGEVGAGFWVVHTTQPDTVTTDFMMGQSTIPVILAGDSIVRHLVVYRTDATIHGAVLIDGFQPGFPVTMMAVNFDTASSSGPVNVKPDRIRLRTTKTAGTVESTLRSMGIPKDDLDDLALLNGMELNESLPANTLVKVIEKGR